MVQSSYYVDQYFGIQIVHLNDQVKAEMNWRLNHYPDWIADVEILVDMTLVVGIYLTALQMVQTF